MKVTSFQIGNEEPVTINTILETNRSPKKKKFREIADRLIASPMKTEGNVVIENMPEHSINPSDKDNCVRAVDNDASVEEMKKMSLNCKRIIIVVCSSIGKCVIIFFSTAKTYRNSFSSQLRGSTSSSKLHSPHSSSQG